MASTLEALSLHVQTNRALEDLDEGKSCELDVASTKRLHVGDTQSRSSLSSCASARIVETHSAIAPRRDRWDKAQEVTGQTLARPARGAERNEGRGSPHPVPHAGTLAYRPMWSLERREVCGDGRSIRGEVCLPHHGAGGVDPVDGGVPLVEIAAGVEYTEGLGGQGGRRLSRRRATLGISLRCFCNDLQKNAGVIRHTPYTRTRHADTPPRSQDNGLRRRREPRCEVPVNARRGPRAETRGSPFS